MGIWANAAARSEIKTRESVLGLLREHRPDFEVGNVLLPCHIISEAHNGFYVKTGTVIVAVFRCQLHWWGRELAADTLAGLRSPNPGVWMSFIGSVPPVDMGSMRGGAPEFAAGLAVGLRPKVENAFADATEPEVKLGTAHSPSTPLVASPPPGSPADHRLSSGTNLPREYSAPAVAGPDVPPLPTQTRRWRTILLSIVATSSVLIALFASLVTFGFNNAYSFTVKDQEARPATSRTVTSDVFGVERTDEQICGIGDDYWNCSNLHIAVYNSVCVGQSLSSTAQGICASMSEFIEEMRSSYGSCGYGCITADPEGGKWGWPYLRLVTDTVNVSDNNKVPEITHEESCYFELGPIAIGNCSAKPDLDSEES